MAVAITTAMQNQIAQNYIAILGRNPDPAGFSFWVQTYADANATPAALTSITNGFGNSAEFRSTYSGLTTDAAIALMYQNVLLRAADAPGLTYWSGIANALIAKGETISNAYAQTGAQMIYTAAANGTSDSASIIARTATAVASGSAAPTTTYTLTTVSPETIDATGSGNKIVNGTLGTTFQAFDSIIGNGTATTFNLGDTTAANFALPASTTMSGLTTVNVSRVATGGGTGAVTITNTTFGAGVKALNYSEGTLAASMTGAAFSATLNSATSVSATANSTGQFTTVAIIDTDATSTATQGSSLATATVTNTTGAVSINGNAVTTVNLNTIGGLTTITSAAGTRALTVNAAGTGAITGLTDAQATTVTVNQTGNNAFGTLTVAKATTVNINATSTATANSTTSTVAAATATTLNIGGTHAQTVTINGASVLLTTVNISGTGGVALGDVSALAVTTVSTANATNVASATGAANATIANSVTLGNAQTFVGGAGTDTITLGANTTAINMGAGVNTLVLTTAALGTGGSVVSGAGTTDVLSMTTANAITASATTTFAPKVTGFERLTMTTNAAGTVDLAQLGNYNYVTFAGGAGALVLNNMASGGTVAWSAANGGGVSLGGSTGSGGSDIINVRLTNSTNALIAYGTISAPNVESIAITMADTQGTPTGILQNTLTLTDAAVTSITVSGTGGLVLTHTAGTALTNFDASGSTLGTGAVNTGVSFTSNANQYATTVKGTVNGGDVLNFAAATAAVTITETAGVNTITGSSTVGSTLIGGTGQDTIIGGAGNDTITVGASAAAANNVTGAAGADSITLTGSVGIDTVIYTTKATSAAAAGANMDTITGFATTIDKISLQFSAGTAGTSTLGFVSGDSTVGTMAAVVADVTNVATLADVYTQLTADLNNVANAFAASATGAGNTVARVVTFANGAAAGTYLVVNDGVAAFQAANDTVIKLVGGTTVVAGDFAYNYVA